jgi:hypothetical protein
MLLQLLQCDSRSKSAAICFIKQYIKVRGRFSEAMMVMDQERCRWEGDEGSNPYQDWVADLQTSF